jgi:RHS repeat-associated protein
MMKRTTTWATALLATVAAAPALANNDLSNSERDGSINAPSIDRSATNPSTLSVNQGKVGYSVPIVGPPGGLVPSLALTYAGGRQEGVVGAGWALSYPSIRVRTSGRGGQPEYGVASRPLGIGGEELVRLAVDAPDQDGDGVPEALYREERDTLFVRYVELSANGWRMDFADGKKLTLGTHSSARVERAGQSGHIVEWLPEVMRDPSGNEQTWIWSTPAQAAAAAGTTALGTVNRYLTGLRWGCTSCASATTYQRISIAYAEAPNHTFDFGPGYLREGELVVSSISTATVVNGAASPVRSYALGYDTSDTRRLLSSVTIAGADGSALPPMTFGYTTRNAPATPTSLATAPGGSIAAFSSGIGPVDVDGDGRKDVTDLSNVGAGAKYYRNRGTASASFGGAVVQIANDPGVSLVAGGTRSGEDTDRNLLFDLFDLCHGVACEPVVFLHDGQGGWQGGVVRGALPFTPNLDTLRIDMNADGIVDLVDTAPCVLGDPWKIHLEDGSGAFAPQIALEAGTTPDRGGVLCGSDAGVVAGDVNGDNLTDIVELETSLSGTVAHVFLGRGRLGFGVLPEDGGNRLPELQYTVTSLGVAPSPSTVQLADVDGDGLDDLVSIDVAADQVRVWRRIPGSGFVETTGPYTQFITNTEGCRVADWDANGVPDVLCSAGQSGAAGWRLHSFASQPAHLLASVSSGMGQVSRISYTTTARVAAAHEAAGHPWTANVAMALPIVATTEVDDGRGNVVITTYDYADAHYETDEVLDHFGLTGFAYVAASQVAYLETTPGNSATRVVDPQDAGVLTRTFFDVGADDYYQRGMLDCMETWPAGASPVGFECDVGAAGPLLRVVNEHSSHTNPDGIVRITVDAEDRWVLEGGPVSAGKRLRSEYEYDAFNNRTKERRFGVYSGARDATGNDEQMIVTDYVRNIDDWLVRLPRLTMSGGMDTSAGGATLEPLATTCFVYDGVTDLCDAGYAGDADGSVSHGLRTATLLYTDDDTSDGAPGIMTTVSEVSYTSRGLPDQVEDAEGHVTDFDYDAAFGLFRTAQTIDPSGLALTTTYQVSTKNGKDTRMTAPDGMITRWQHDDLGRLTKLARPGDTLASPTLTRSYQLAAPVSSITDVGKDGSPDGLSTVSRLDGAGQLLCKQKEGLAGSSDILEQREHSGRGMVVLEYLPAQASGCDVASRSAAGRSTNRNHDVLAFDALSRLVSTRHEPSGSVATTVHRVLEVELADEEDNDPQSPHHGTSVVRRFDGLGRMTSAVERIDADGNGVLEDSTMTYGYDPLGRATAVVDQLGATIFEARYDSRGRKVWSRDVDRGVMTSDHDGLDREVLGTDARGATVTRTFDAAGRLLSVVADDGVAALTSSYHYDVHVLGGALDASCRMRGRLGWVDDASGRSAFCYDDRGRVIAEETTITGQGSPLRTQSTWDSLDRRKTVVHPDNTKLTYGYGADGRAATLTVSMPAGAAYTMVTGASYDAAGHVTLLQYGNGAVIETAHDDRLRPTRHRALLGGVALDLELSLDRTGNVEAITDHLGSRSAAFAYDDHNRLVSASGDFVGGDELIWGYDARGNMTSMGRTSATAPPELDTLFYSHPVHVHALTGVDRGSDGTIDESLSHDAAGHIVDDGLHGFEFDANGMLTRVESGATEVLTQAFDYQQRRVVTTYPSGDAVYFVRAANAELREVGGSLVARKFVTFSGRTIGVVEGTFTNANKASKIFLYAHDHLGGHPLVFDIANPATVIERWASYPYGEDNLEPLDADGQLSDYSLPSDPSSKLSHRFQGREVDAQLPELRDFGARTYSTRLARFLSPDAVVPKPGSSQDWNRYAFVYNNPLRYIDPSGHEPITMEDVDWAMNKAEAGAKTAREWVQWAENGADALMYKIRGAPTQQEAYRQQAQAERVDWVADHVPVVSTGRAAYVILMDKDLAGRPADATDRRDALVTGISPPGLGGGKISNAADAIGIAGDAAINIHDSQEDIPGYVDQAHGVKNDVISTRDSIQREVDKVVRPWARKFIDWQPFAGPPSEGLSPTAPAEPPPAQAPVP